MTGVAVWSFMNERRQWSPYEPSVSREIENVFSISSNGQSSPIVNLGTISPNLSCYQVDVVNMRQLQMYSGSTRPVQRSVCPPTSALANGFVWEFEGDQPSHWIIYDIDTMTILEEEYTKFTQSGAPTILDLQQSTLRLPYIVDFGNYTQTRVETGKVRKIQRRPLNQPYSPVPVLTNSALSLPSSSSSSSQGNGAVSSNPAKQKTSKSRKHRNQPYTVKSGSNHAIQAPAQGPSQNAGAQMNFTNVMPYQQQQGLQLQQQQLLQQQQQQQQQMQNSQGPLTRSRIQTTGQGTGQSLVVPALQQQQQPHTQHPAMPHQLLHHQLLQQHQQQQQQQHPSQPMLYQPQPLHGMMGIPAQLLHPQGQGPLPAFPYPPVINHQLSSLGQMPQQQPASSAQQQSQQPGSSSSSTQAHPPVALPSVSKITIGKTKKSKPKTGLEVLGRYMTQINTDLDKHDCCICYDKLSEASSYGEGQPDAHDAVKLGQCGHMFHKLCLLEMYNSIHKDESLQCPSCKTIYGEKTGNCPPGYMQWKVVQGLHLAGYEDCDAIVVSYHISPGVQGPEHPQPGQRYSTRGFPRQGFIPNCDQGRKVLKLLIEAFKRRLMFTIGTSHTTGESNTVVWNEIHHKTEPHGNYSGHGFPDPKYLDNALLELAAHGVTEDCLS